MNIKPAALTAQNPDLGAVVTQALAKRGREVCARLHDKTLMVEGLVAASTALADDLAGHSIAKGEPVVIEVLQSFDLLVGLCAILQAGGVAVPVDPDLPAERRDAIVTDAAARLQITVAPEHGGLSVTNTGVQPVLAPDLAFLVYTSGSSGRPKGVEISHAAYVGRLLHITENAPAKPRDVDLLWTPSSFIGMLDEVFFPLLLGVPIAIAPAQARKDPLAFARLIKTQGVTTFRITPSLLNVFLTPATAADLSGLRAIYCSGETLGPEVQRKVHDLLPDVQLFGFYGATEAPGVAYHIYDPHMPPLSASLCTPQDFATIAILDETGTPVQNGAAGEILIGGLALAQGYWNRPALTGTSFKTIKGQRFYRTGDLGRWQSDGQFEILGRADLSEVNIAGVRVNLPEVCDALRGLDPVRDAWVSAVQSAPHTDPVLVAHIVPKGAGDLDLSDLRAALVQKLPRAAVPAHLRLNDPLPLMVNGKLDIQTLATRAQTYLDQRAAKPAPRASPSPNVSPQARALLPAVLEAVENLLCQSGLSGDEDFFDLGGTSLQAVELGLILDGKLGANASSGAVFNSRRLSDIAENLTQGAVVAAGPLRLLRDGDPLLPPIFTLNATSKYAMLSKALRNPAPVYNLNLFGLTAQFIDTLDTVTLRDIAQKLADEILTQHPLGPWRLMAFCQDGCLAVEIGRILQSQSEQPCELLLIDTFFLDHGPSLKMTVMRLFDLGPGYYLGGLWSKLLRKRTPRSERRTQMMSPQQSAALFNKSKEDGRLYAKYMEFFTSYTPQPYGGPVSLFVSKEWQHAPLRSLSHMAGAQLSVTRFAGLHATIFNADKVQHLAKAVDGRLDLPVSR